VAGNQLTQRRVGPAAVGHGELAAIGEAAAGAGFDQLGHRAGDGLEPLLVRGRQVDARDRPDQALGVRVARVGEQLADRGLLAPWIGMWAANMVLGALGVYLTVRTARETPSLSFAWAERLVPRFLRSRDAAERSARA